MPETNEAEQKPITVGTVKEWGPWIAGLFVFVVVATAGGVMSFANLRSDVSVNTRAIERNDEASKQRHDQQQRQIDNLSTKGDERDKLLIELLRKMDVVVEKVTAMEQRQNAAK